MKIYFDENFPYQIARALTILEEPSQEVVTVMNVSEEFGRGAKTKIGFRKLRVPLT